MEAHQSRVFDCLLRDGTSVRIRPIGPDDRDALVALFGRLSAQSIYYRFFNVKRRLTDAELRDFIEVDGVSRAALVGTIRRDGGERIIGVARYVRTSQEPPRAEVAFTVDDAWQGKGLGTLLLEQLAVVARANGISEFEADVLGDNNRMLEVFAESGFRVERSLAGGVIHVRFPTAETEELRRAHVRRDRQAAAESVRAILAPRSVVLVGPSRLPGTIGAALAHNLLAAGFTGRLYFVHPSADSIEGMPVHRSISAIGEPIDLAVIAVPAAQVLDVAAECARAGVRALVVISAGFGEVSPKGLAMQRRLVDLARSAGMRLVGPNCLGVLNTDPSVRLNATFAPTWPPAGNVAMLSQSGALGLAILDRVRDLHIGISSFASVGNKADVSGNDLISYWATDPQTRVILLYLESFGNPRRFAHIAPQVAREKPIVAVKSGRSAAGTRAAQSHSASLATLDIAVDALFEQAGVIRTATLEDLFDVAVLLSTQPVPAGRRVGVVTNAGGPGILFADACEAAGLELPLLAPETTAALRSFLPPAASIGNPVDMIASATPEHYAQAIAAVGNDPNVDALVTLYVPPMVTDPEAVAQAIARGAGALPPDKPILTVFLSARGAPPVLGGGPRGALPSYDFPENAARALAAAARYGTWKARPPGEAITLDPFARDAIRAVVERTLADAGGPHWLAPSDVATVLRAAGIPHLETVTAAPEEALEAATRLGFPLVAKAASPGLIHKTEVGGVILDIETPEQLAAAVQRLRENLAAAERRLDGVLLQRHVPQGIEALVGLTTDPTFGPLLVCGLGGTLVELLRDVAHHLVPVTDRDAEEMLGRLRTSRLLDGYRGAPAGDRPALIDVICRVSALAEVVPEIVELDLNPVKVLEPGRGAIVVDARIRLG
ncbi:MAG TPA: GNAT family N-acetyltransferase [Candidatus Limnocylindria bacterium]|nr:GNAT family N-acetyltransferase [Candidatus Limnocylindria bacterium]